MGFSYNICFSITNYSITNGKSSIDGVSTEWDTHNFVDYLYQDGNTNTKIRGKFYAMFDADLQKMQFYIELLDNNLFKASYGRMPNNSDVEIFSCADLGMDGQLIRDRIYPKFNQVGYDLYNVPYYASDSYFDNMPDSLTMAFIGIDGKKIELSYRAMWGSWETLIVVYVVEAENQSKTISLNLPNTDAILSANGTSFKAHGFDSLGVYRWNNYSYEICFNIDTSKCQPDIMSFFNAWGNAGFNLNFYDSAWKVCGGVNWGGFVDLMLHYNWLPYYWYDEKTGFCHYKVDFTQSYFDKQLKNAKWALLYFYESGSSNRPTWLSEGILLRIYDLNNWVTTDITSSPTITNNLNALLRNYPNPFNHSTKITVALNQKSKIEISIYDLLGQNIKKIYDDFCTTGNLTLEWNGTDRNNQNVPTGIYFVQLLSEKHRLVHKIIYAK